MTKHQNLANSELHEPKGISSATDGDYYVADGLGSGSMCAPLEDVGSWTFSTSVSVVEFTSLGSYTSLLISAKDLTFTTNTDTKILVQLGDDASYTTSSIYYSFGTGISTQNIGFVPALFYDNTPLHFNSFFCQISSFNKATHRSQSTSRYCMSDSATLRIGKANALVREAKAYTKLRLITESGDNFEGGTILVTGIRG